MATIFEYDDPPLKRVDSTISFGNYVLVQFRQELLACLLKSNNDIALGDLLDQEDEEKLMQFNLDNSNHKLRMYGTARELVEQLKIYRNFPECQSCFGKNNVNPYYTTPIVYHSLKNEKYICKPDLFVLLQNMTFQRYPALKADIYIPLLSSFLKSQETKISAKLEFVQYDPEVFKEIETEIGRPEEAFTSGLHIYSFESIRIKLKELMPIVWSDDEHEVLREFLEITYYEQSEEERQNIIGCYVFICNFLIPTFQNIMEKRPELFLLHSETKNNKMPVTVRLFEDGTQKFVMKTELYQAMKKSSEETSECHILGFETIGIAEVFEKFQDEIENIEFIRFPILRAKHKAVPIRSPNRKSFCMLAVDVLFDLLNHLIFVAKFFQDAERVRIDMMMLFKQLELTFKPDETNQYFMRIDGYHCIRDSINDQLRILCGNVILRDVRNAKKDGFTVENLKNELKHLGLTETFPEIINHVEEAYAEVMRVKNEKFLRTCDLFDAIEHCQLICIFNRFPNLRKFLHNQNGCGRVLTLKCELCLHEQKVNSKDISTPKKEKSNIEKTLAINQVTKTPESKADSQKRKKNKIDEKPLVIQDDKLSKPSSSSQKQSKSCDKCFRTSEMHNETKKELKTIQNKMKKLEKKISENEKNMKEEKSKNEKIIQEQKKEMEKKMKEIENLKKEIADHIDIVTDNEEMTLKILSMEIKETQMIEDDIKKEQTFLEKQTEMSEIISQLREQLDSENQKTQLLEQEILELQEKVQTEKEDIWITEKCEFEQKLQEKTRQINEFHESNIRLKAENEVNGRMIQQLMDKLTKATVNTPTNQNTHQLHPYYQNVSIHPMQMGYAPGAYSLPSTSSLITNSSFVEDSKCLICPIALKPTDSMIRCQKCKKRLHSNCASNWLKISKKCPECSEDLLAPSKLRPF